MLLNLLKILKRIPAISKDELLIVYKAMIRSILEYNSPLFVGATQNQAILLEKVQKRCHKIIGGSNCHSSCFVPLTERRLHQAMKIFKASLKNTHATLYTDTHLKYFDIPNIYFSLSFVYSKTCEFFFPLLYAHF